MTYRKNELQQDKRFVDGRVSIKSIAAAVAKLVVQEGLKGAGQISSLLLQGKLLINHVLPVPLQCLVGSA